MDENLLVDFLRPLTKPSHKDGWGKEEMLLLKIKVNYFDFLWEVVGGTKLNQELLEHILQVLEIRVEKLRKLRVIGRDDLGDGKKYLDNSN